jgi:signal transduction histidine kinase
MYPTMMSLSLPTLFAIDAGFTLAGVFGLGLVGVIVAFLLQLKAHKQKLAEAKEELRFCVEQTAEALEALQAEKPVAIDSLSALPEGTEETERWTAAYQKLAQKIATPPTYASVPMPLLMIDAKGIVRVENDSAVAKHGSCKGKSITSLVAEIPGQKVPPLVEWLRGQHGTRRTMTMKTAEGKTSVVELMIVEKAQRDKWGYLGVLILDQTERLRNDAARTIQTRKTVAKQLLGRVTRELTGIADIANHVNVVTREAKQTAYREKLLPRLKSIEDKVNQLTALNQTLIGCDVFFRDTRPTTTATEFMAIEAVRAVMDSIGGRLASKNIRVEIADERSGWVLCDEACLRTTLSSVLLHAADSCSDMTITLLLTRTIKAEPEKLLFTFSDIGPSMPTNKLNALDNPFTGSQSVDLDTFADGGGFPLSLILARKMAEVLGGALQFETVASRLKVILELPTRTSGATMLVEEPEGLDSAPVEEICSGWSLGIPQESPVRKGAKR